MAGAKRTPTAADFCCYKTACKRLKEAQASGAGIEFAQLVLDHANEERRARDAELVKHADDLRLVAGEYSSDDESSEAETARAAARAAYDKTKKAKNARTEARLAKAAADAQTEAEKFPPTVNTRAARDARKRAAGAMSRTNKGRAVKSKRVREDAAAARRADADAFDADDESSEAEDARAAATAAERATQKAVQAAWKARRDEAAADARTKAAAYGELTTRAATTARAAADAAEHDTQAGRQREWERARAAHAADVALYVADLESDDSSSEAEYWRGCLELELARRATVVDRQRARRAADHCHAVLAHAAMTAQDPATVVADGRALGRVVADWCAAKVAEGRDRGVQSRVYVGNCAEWRRKGHVELRAGLKRKRCAAKGPGSTPLPIERLTVRYWGPYEAKAKANLGEVVAHYHTAAELGVEVIVHDLPGAGGLSHKRGGSYVFAWVADVLPGDVHRPSRFVVGDGLSFSANLEAELAAASATEPMPALASDGDVDVKLRKRGGGSWPGTYHAYTRGRWFVREWTRSGSPRAYERARYRPSADVARADVRKLVAQKTAEDYNRGVYDVVA